MGTSVMPEEESKLHDQIDSGEVEAFKYSASHWPMAHFLKSWVECAADEDCQDWAGFSSKMKKKFEEQRTDPRIPTPDDWRLQQRLMVCARHLTDKDFQPPRIPPRPLNQEPTLEDLAKELGLVFVGKPKEA